MIKTLSGKDTLVKPNRHNLQWIQEISHFLRTGITYVGLSKLLLEIYVEFEWGESTRHPYTATISWSVYLIPPVVPYLWHTTMSCMMESHHSLLVPQSTIYLHYISKWRNLISAEATHSQNLWVCFCCHVAHPTNKAVNCRPCITELLSMASVFSFCRFIVAHTSPTRTWELNSRHQQSPMRVEGLLPMGCCPVPRRDLLRHCYHRLSAMYDASHLDFGGPEPCLPL
jgi:hypothetical protein